MPRRLISSGSPFEKSWGYSRAVVDGDMIFVSGTTGYDYATMTMPDSVEAQARNQAARRALQFQCRDVRNRARQQQMQPADRAQLVPGGRSLLERDVLRTSRVDRNVQG